MCGSGSSGFIDLSVESISSISLCWLASTTSLTHERSGALWGGGARPRVLNGAERGRVRGQLRRRPQTLLSERFDSSIVGIGVVVLHVWVGGGAPARLLLQTLLAELRVGGFDSERETPVRRCGTPLKPGLMMTQVNYHTYIPRRCAGMRGNTDNRFCVGGKRHLLISPPSPQIISPLSLILHPLQLVIAQDIRLLPLHSRLCLLLLLFSLPESEQMEHRTQSSQPW